MITQDTIKELATKYQTSELNVAREYCQHLFLSYFYRQKGSEKVLFKDGTALRMIYQSPRFSEDLDFSGFKVSSSSIEELVEDTLLEIEREGFNILKRIWLKKRFEPFWIERNQGISMIFILFCEAVYRYQAATDEAMD